MRRLFTLAIIIIFSISLNAQIRKGSIFLGGDLSGGLSTTKVADSTYNKQNGVNISPVFGKAVKDDLILGGHLNLNFSENDYSGVYPDQSDNSYGGGIFLRKYKAIGKGNLYIFLDGSLNYSYRHYKYGNSAYSSDMKQNIIYISAFPGLSYAVTKKLHLETGFRNLLNLNYSHEKKIESNLSTTTYTTNHIGFDSNLDNLSTLYIGFRWLISK
jgi:hypothetical protein